MISVVLVTRDRVKLLNRCLESVEHELNGYLKAGTAEVKIVINGTATSTMDRLVGHWIRPWIEWIPLESSENPGGARNRAISRCRGDWILFVDDDAYLPSGFRLSLEKVLTIHSDCALIGGPNLTPPDALAFSRAVGQVLQTRFGAFFSHVRYRAEGRSRRCGDESLMLCNLLVRKSAVERYSVRFDPRLKCNEENLLIQNLIEAGEQAVYDPDFWVFHERRGSLAELVSQVFKYGRGRAQNTRLKPKSVRLAHLIPCLWLLYLTGFLTGGLFLGFYRLDLRSLDLYWLGAPLGIYTLVVFVHMVRSRSWVVGAIFPAIHLAYGAGFLFGWFRDADSFLEYPNLDRSRRTGAQPDVESDRRRFSTIVHR